MFFIVLIFSFVSSLPRPNIIPEPVSIDVNEGTFELISKSSLIYNSSFPGLIDVINYGARILRVSTGFVIYNKTDNILNPNDKNSNNDIYFETSNLRVMKDEEYELEVTPTTVKITSSTKSGFFYGFITFLQLFNPEIFHKHTVLGRKWVIPCVKIVDYPRLKWRGVMLDVARHFFDVADVKKLLDSMCIQKLNILHLHLTDDNGWRIRIDKYPLFTEIGSVARFRPLPWNKKLNDSIQYGPFFFTKNEIKELLKYANQRSIKIVPEIEMPGHSRAGVSAYPEISCRQQSGIEPLPDWTGNDDIFCPGNDKTLEILDDVIDEIIDLFVTPSNDIEYIHTGGDECSQVLWKTCPKCQKRIKDEGLEGGEDSLRFWFAKKISEHISKNHSKNKDLKMIGWDEILSDTLPEDVAVMSWRGVSGGQKAASKGHKVVMSPDTHLYLDHNQFSGKDCFEYLCCLKPLYFAYHYEPTDGIDLAYKENVIGVQGNMWTEYVWGGIDDVFYKVFPRSIAVSEIGWTPLSMRNWTRFVSSLDRCHIQRLKNMDINTAPISNAPKIQYKLEFDGGNGSEWKSFSWIIDNGVMHPGKYEAAFIWTNGNGKMAVRNVNMQFDGINVAEDKHVGKVYQDKTEIYGLFTIWPATEKEKITLNAEMKVEEGTNCEGDVLLYFTLPF